MKLRESPIILRVKENCSEKLSNIVQAKTPSVFVVQGLPASGKTTFLNNIKDYFDRTGISSSVIHSDNYIEDFSEIMSNERKYRIGVIDIFRKKEMPFEWRFRQHSAAAKRLSIVLQEVSGLTCGSRASRQRRTAFFNRSSQGEVRGNFIVSMLKNLIPKAEIGIFKTKGRQNCDAKSVLKQLKKINSLPEDKKFDYINLSTLFMADYNSINPQQLHFPDNMERIRANMPKTILHIVEEIEKIVKNGTEVFIFAGNSSSSFNLLSLAKGSRTVGVQNCDRFTQNSLIEDFVRLPYGLAKGNETAITVPQAIAEDIKHREIARKFVESDYELYAKMLGF